MKVRDDSYMLHRFDINNCVVYERDDIWFCFDKLFLDYCGKDSDYLESIVNQDYEFMSNRPVFVVKDRHGSICCDFEVRDDCRSDCVINGIPVAYRDRDKIDFDSPDVICEIDKVNASDRRSFNNVVYGGCTDGKYFVMSHLPFDVFIKHLLAGDYGHE